MFGTQKNFNPNNDYEVPKSPSDSISDIAWGHQQDWLVASSWDSKVDFYRENFFLITIGIFMGSTKISINGFTTYIQCESTSSKFS
jgi:hypothetical protein